MTTDPIKALVDLGPEIKRRVKLIDEGVMVNGRNTEATQSQILHAVLAAIEALTPTADGTSVVVIEDMLGDLEAAYARGQASMRARAAKWHENMFRNKTGEDKNATPEQAEKFMSRLLWHSWASAAISGLEIEPSPSASTGKDEAAARLLALEGALKPFSETAKLYNHPYSQPDVPDNVVIIQWANIVEKITVGDLRRAARALKTGKSPPPLSE